MIVDVSKKQTYEVRVQSCHLLGAYITTAEIKELIVKRLHKVPDESDEYFVTYTFSKKEDAEYFGDRVKDLLESYATFKANAEVYRKFNSPCINFAELGIDEVK